MIPLCCSVARAFILLLNVGCMVMGLWWKAQLIIVFMVCRSVVSFLIRIIGWSFFSRSVMFIW